MFAIFGLGVPEIIILAILAVVCVGVPIVVIGVILTLTRRSRGAVDPSVAEMQAEIDRLRDEVERLKRGPTS